MRFTVYWNGKPTASKRIPLSNDPKWEHNFICWLLVNYSWRNIVETYNERRKKTNGLTSRFIFCEPFFFLHSPSFFFARCENSKSPMCFDQRVQICWLRLQYTKLYKMKHMWNDGTIVARASWSSSQRQVFQQRTNGFEVDIDLVFTMKASKYKNDFDAI